MKTMGIRGYEGYEGYESSPRKTRHIFSWGYGDTRDTRALPEKPDTFLSENTRIPGYQTLFRGYRTKIRDWGDQAA